MEEKNPVVTDTNTQSDSPVVQSTEQNTSPTPPQPEVDLHTEIQKKNRKYLILGLVALLLIILAGLGYVILNSEKIDSNYSDPSPTPEATSDPMADWKTYNNEEFGFSVSYTQDMDLYILDKDMLNPVDALGKILFLRPTPKELAGSYSWDLSIYSNPLFKTFEDYKNPTINKVDSPCEPNTKSVKDIMFNDIAGKELSVTCFEGATNETIVNKFWFVERLGKTFVFHPNYKLLNDEGIYNQILSTFKFIENETSPTSNNQKTYKNTFLGYSISFPNNWEAHHYNPSSGSSQKASAASQIVEIGDTTKSSAPYPSGIIRIQGFDEIPKYDSSWTKSIEFTDSKVTATKYEKQDAEDGPTTSYFFQNSPGARYIEVKFVSSKEGTTYKTLEQMVNSFKFEF